MVYVPLCEVEYTPFHLQSDVLLRINNVFCETVREYDTIGFNYTLSDKN